MLKSFPHYFFLMRLHKPIGILLLLWPTLWALWIASHGHPDLKILCVFIFGVIVMRSAGCVINDFADRNIDLHVERTKDRPLSKGLITEKQAIGLFVFLCLIAFVLVLQLNFLTLKLSVIALFLAIIYPFTKRYTHLPQFILGLAFAWSIPMAFAAQTNAVPSIAWLLFLIGTLWPVTYDTMYAMADRLDDLKIGIKSTAILFGQYDRFCIGIIQVMVLLLFFFMGKELNFKTIYFMSLAAATGLCIYQQYLIRDSKPELCLRAFKNNNYVGAIIFLGIALNYF